MTETSLLKQTRSLEYYFFRLSSIGVYVLNVIPDCNMILWVKLPYQILVIKNQILETTCAVCGCSVTPFYLFIVLKY